MNKLGNVHTSSNNSKTKVDDLNVKLKTVPVDLKKLSDVLSKGVLKKIQQTKYSKSLQQIKYEKN